MLRCSFLIPMLFSCSLCSAALAAPQEEPAKAKGPTVQQLAKQAKIKLDKAIELALVARPGTAAGVEMEQRRAEHAISRM